MKMLRVIIVLLASAVSVSAFAEPRLETRDGFCHFIVSPANDDYEDFRGTCENSITPNDDAVATGYASINAKYSVATAPFTANVVYTQDNVTDANGNAVQCVMVDSNGTNYNSDNWVQSVLVSYDNELINEFRESFYKSDSDRFDYDNNGIVNYADLSVFKVTEPVVTIKYRLSCFDAPAQ